MGTRMSLAMELVQVTSVMLGAVAVRINLVTAATVPMVVATAMMLESDVHVRKMEE